MMRFKVIFILLSWNILFHTSGVGWMSFNEFHYTRYNWHPINIIIGVCVYIYVYIYIYISIYV